MRTVTVGTRGSTLAVSQTRWAVERLKERHPELEFHIKTIQTSGDRNRASLMSMAKSGDKGFWIKEIQEALLEGSIDVAVHSLKDLPTEQTPRLEIAALPKRADARDVLIGSEGFKTLAELPAGARVGTSSVRRRAFLKASFPQLEIVPLRGNIESRIAALEGDFDAVILAGAGLIRIDQRQRIDEFISPDVLLPAPGQGALALEVRADDELMNELVYSINDRPTDDCITAERAFLAGLGAGCLAPVGALAAIKGEVLTLEGWVGAVDGSKVIKATISGGCNECQELGAELAEDMLAQGAAKLIEAARL